MRIATCEIPDAAGPAALMPRLTLPANNQKVSRNNSDSVHTITKAEKCRRWTALDSKNGGILLRRDWNRGYDFRPDAANLPLPVSLWRQVWNRACRPTRWRRCWCLPKLFSYDQSYLWFGKCFPWSWSEETRQRLTPRRMTCLRKRSRKHSKPLSPQPHEYLKKGWIKSVGVTNTALEYIVATNNCSSTSPRRTSTAHISVSIYQKVHEW